MELDVLIEAADWNLLGLDGLAQRAAPATLLHLGLDPRSFEISLLGCDDARIATLNQDFRSKPEPTNVLSWPSLERGAETPGTPPQNPEPGELGDIAIAYETCAREAEAATKPLEDHVTHLLVHGILHLLGYDHIEAGDAALMERLEVEILASLGLPDPY